MNSKPITANMKQKVNNLWWYMIHHNRYIDKDEICKVIGCKNERSARDVISVLASKKPVISTSDGKGYKLALTSQDIDEARHTWAELSSRIEELQKRIKPLIKFVDSFHGVNGDIK